jgi:mRNA-degrading endonuclease RelE of RelBE toxin-antitoxin system
LPDWRILLTSAAQKSLRQLGPPDQNRVRHAIDNLMAGDIKKLQGRRDTFRLRVGDNRVVFLADFHPRRIIVLDVFPRGAGYR